MPFFLWFHINLFALFFMFCLYPVRVHGYVFSVNSTRRESHERGSFLASGGGKPTKLLEFSKGIDFS